MILKFKETEFEYEIDANFFENRLPTHVGEYEFVSGTAKEKGIFNKLLKSQQIKEADDIDKEKLLLEA